MPSATTTTTTGRRGCHSTIDVLVSTRGGGDDKYEDNGDGRATAIIAVNDEDDFDDVGGTAEDHALFAIELQQQQKQQTTMTTMVDPLRLQ